MRKKFKIENWGAPHRRSRLFRSIGNLTLFIVVAVVLFFGAFFGARYLRSVIENSFITRIIESTPSISGTSTPQGQGTVRIPASAFPSSAAPIVLPGTAPSEDLTGSSFTDLFSGMGWINQDETTMYEDRLVTAFLFPPEFGWDKTDPPSAGSQSFIARDSDGSDERCLNGHCLKQRGLALAYDGGAVELPDELRQKNVLNLSIGAAKTFWLVGATVGNDGSYEGMVFSYKDGRFTKIFPAQSGYSPFISAYKGVLGFGGDDGDWLAVYGAYEGKAVRVRGTSYADISRFFGIRVMNGGFEAVVTKTPVGWYVWSVTDNNPKLVKLFDNGTGEIQGATDLSPQLFESGGIIRASFVPLSGRALLAKVRTAADDEYRLFTDDGFLKTETGKITSLNLSHYPAEVRTATIQEMDFGSRGANAAFFLSNDGETWEKAAVGKTITFKNKSGRMLFWRGEFAPDSNQNTTPFLDRIEIFFQVKFL